MMLGNELPAAAATDTLGAQFQRTIGRIPRCHRPKSGDFILKAEATVAHIPLRKPRSGIQGP